MTPATNSKIFHPFKRFYFRIFWYEEHISTFCCWENSIHSISWQSTMLKYISLVRNITGCQTTCFWKILLNNAYRQSINTKNNLLIEYVKNNCLMKTKFWLTSPYWKDIENTSVAFLLILSIWISSKFRFCLLFIVRKFCIIYISESLDRRFIL